MISEWAGAGTFCQVNEVLGGTCQKEKAVGIHLELAHSCFSLKDLAISGAAVGLHLPPRCLYPTVIAQCSSPLGRGFKDWQFYGSEPLFLESWLLVLLGWHGKWHRWMSHLKITGNWEAEVFQCLLQLLLLPCTAGTPLELHFCGNCLFPVCSSQKLPLIYLC